MLFYSLLFITVTIVTSFIIFGIRSKSTENRVLFQILPVSFIYVLIVPFQLIEKVKFTGMSEYSVAAVVLAVTAGYAILAVAILGVVGIIRGFKEKDGVLQASSITILLSLCLMSIFHPIYQIIPLFILGNKAVRKWKNSGNESGKEQRTE